MDGVRLFVAAFLSPLLLGAADAPAEADYAADARSIERLVNEDYAYLDRFEGGRMPMSEKLRAEAEAVDSRDALIRYAERALATLADHHAITGSSLSDSWSLVPSYSDLWVEPRGDGYAITAVRQGSPAAGADIRVGDRLVAVGGVTTAQAVEAFWADLGLPVTGDRAGYAARVLAAGRRNAPRQLTIGRDGERRDLVLPNLYAAQRADREPVEMGIWLAGSDRARNARVEQADIIRFNDSLGDNATIAAFDDAMTRLRPGKRLIIELTDTASGGNTSVARAVMGWFVDRPTSYQVHTLPAEERQTGIPRQWIEQVLPRPGKHHDGPVTVKVGRWTGSMGEGLAVGFDAIGARVEGERMAGLLGAVYDYRLEHSGLVIKVPVERLFHVGGTPREAFRPEARRFRNHVRRGRLIRTMKPLTEEHLAILRRHMVELVEIHFDLAGDEIGHRAPDPALRRALLEVPRHLFVPLQLAGAAYQDTPLPIGFDKTLSQPFIGALMIDLLELTPGTRVLEVGTGLGYQAAVMAEMGADVFSVEVVEEFAVAARALLKALGHTVEVRTGDGSRGWPEHAPFDAILVTAAAPEPPDKLVEQLAPGGRMVIPLGDGDVQQLSVVEKALDGTLAIIALMPVRFTRLELAG